MINNEQINKDPYLVPYQAPLIILDSKSGVCMSKNGSYTKHTRHGFIIMHFVRNGEEWNMHYKVCCEGGLELENIVTRNVRENELNPTLRYTMVILGNWHNNFTRGLIGYKIFLRTLCYKLVEWVELKIQLNEF